MDEIKPAAVCRRSNIGSRVNREVHARFWERLEVKFSGRPSEASVRCVATIRPAGGEADIPTSLKRRE